MKKAIAFIRVSTVKQDEGARQLLQVRKSCIKNGWKLLEERTITEIVSGKKDEDLRAGLIELKELTTDDADIIIVSESSRITRKDENDSLDLYYLIKAITNTGFELHIAGTNEIYPPFKKFSSYEVQKLIFEAERNSKELETSKMRFATGKDIKAAYGGFIGHKISYGYIRIGGKKEPNYLQINEDEAQIIRVMFDLVGKQGYSANQTALHLMRVYNCKWDTRSVLRMLKNTIYKGDFKVLDYQLNAPAIVSAELFDTVQENLTTNHLFINKGDKHYNPLKGIAKCACGEAVYIHNVGKGNGKTYYNYQCCSKNSAYTHKTACENKSINSELLINIVWKITAAYINLDDFKVKTEQQKKTIKSEIKAIERRIINLAAEKKELAGKIESLTDTIIEADALSKPILLKRLSEMAGKNEANEKEVEKANREAAKAANRLKDLAVALLPTLVKEISPEEKHEIFVKYIQTVTYYSVNQNKGFVHLLYKNGLESVVMVSSRPTYVAYQLPDTFKFNPANRTVIDETYDIKPDTFEIPAVIHNELTYDEIVKNYYLETFKLDL